LEAKLAEDIDAQIDALERSAPDAPNEPSVGSPTPRQPAEQSEADAGEDFTALPPDEVRNRYENTQKALRAERDRRRAVEQQTLALQAEQQRMEQAFQRMQAQYAERVMALQAPPDPYQDPDGAREYQQHVQAAIVEQQQQAFQRQQHEMAQRQRQLQYNAMYTAIDDYETEFRSKAPDYDAAVDFLEGQLANTLKNSGYSEEQRKHFAGEMLIQIATNAMRNGISPAAAMYNSAKDNGWSGAVAPGAEKLAQIKQGREAAKTLSGGGAGPSGGVSLKSMAQLEGAAFDSAFDKFLSDAVKGR
jgi:hypothetical protein